MHFRSFRSSYVRFPELISNDLDATCFVERWRYSPQLIHPKPAVILNIELLRTTFSRSFFDYRESIPLKYEIRDDFNEKGTIRVLALYWTAMARRNELEMEVTIIIFEKCRGLHLK